MSVAVYDDIQVKLIGRHGPSSWDGIVEASSHLTVGTRIVLRTVNPQFEPHPHHRLRLLNVLIDISDESLLENKGSPIIVTMGSGSEMFIILE
jgi:hypothetical protein